jgi:hypothetical protein
VGATHSREEAQEGLEEVHDVMGEQGSGKDQVNVGARHLREEAHERIGEQGSGKD